MNDRKLLELAAKAAGVDPQWRDKTLSMYSPDLPDPIGWNPLTDDGDALRLAVKLRLMIDIVGGKSFACWGIVNGKIQRKNEVMHSVSDGIDPFAATRRAIVHAAAEIGKNL